MINNISPEIKLYRQVCDSKNRPKLGIVFAKSGLKPHKMQQDLIDVWDRQYKTISNIIMPSGRRIGKSHTVAEIVKTELVIPQASVLLVSPSDKQLSIIFDLVVKGVKQLGLPITKIDVNKRVLKLGNGAEFYGGSEKTVTDLEGKKCSLLVIDEAGLVKDLNKILNSLRPALMTYGVYQDTKVSVGRMIVLGTPKDGAVDYYNLYLNAKGDPTYFVAQYPSEVNPINTHEFLEAENKRLDKDTYLQEYEGKFVAVTKGRAFYSFGENNVKDISYIKALLDEDAEVILGVDIGATDHSSGVLIYFEKGTFYVIDYFTINNVEEKIIADKISELENKYKVSPIRYIDPSAKLTRLGLANTYDIACFPAKNAVSESVSIINQLFRQERLVIDKSLDAVIRQIDTLRWKNQNAKGAEPFIRDKKHHHDVVAALRYGVYSAYLFMGLQTQEEVEDE